MSDDPKKTDKTEKKEKKFKTYNSNVEKEEVPEISEETEVGFEIDKKEYSVSIGKLCYVYKQYIKKESKRKEYPPLHIGIDGNISCGKSTLCSKNMPTKYKKYKIKQIPENIPPSLLCLFYSNLDKKPNPYAFTLQLNQLSRKSADISNSIANNKHKSILTFYDRTSVGNYGFAFQHFWNGNINKNEFKSYVEEAEIAKASEIFGKFNKLIYLFATPERCLEAVKARNNVDSCVPISLLQELDIIHTYIYWWLLLFYPQLKINIVDWECFGTGNDIIKIALSEKTSKMIFYKNEQSEQKDVVIFDFKENLEELNKNMFPTLESHRYIHSQKQRNLINKALSENKIVICKNYDTTDFIIKNLTEIITSLTK